MERSPGQEQNCTKCVILKYTNFGIYRDVCNTCLNKNVCMQQRCLVCEKIGLYYYNYKCQNCVSRLTYLCEETGYLYFNENVHFQICWCLNHEQQVMRNKQNRRPPSLIA